MILFDQVAVAAKKNLLLVTVALLIAYLDGQVLRSLNSTPHKSPWNKPFFKLGPPPGLEWKLPRGLDSLDFGPPMETTKSLHVKSYRK